MQRKRDGSDYIGDAVTGLDDGWCRPRRYTTSPKPTK